MSISVQNRKILWGHSGNRCAFPGCNQELHSSNGKDAKTIVGQECHIEAQSPGGPRFNPALSEAQIDSYENLILLCSNHHRIIDANPDQYTVAALKKMKTDHEKQVRRALEDKSEFDNMSYEAIVVYIEMMLDFETWDQWTSYLLSADGPMLSVNMQESIEEIKQYILSRVWVGRYADLEESIKEFRRVLIDFNDVFHRHSEQKGEWFITQKFYKVKPYDHVIADKLLVDYKMHLQLVNNLVYEMTRSANRICDLMRKYVDPLYRFADGKLTSYDDCPEYRDGEKYPGLEEFEKIYRTRDVFV